MDITLMFAFASLGLISVLFTFFLSRKSHENENLRYQLKQAISQVEKLEFDIKHAQGEKVEGEALRYALEKELALEKERYRALEERLTDWEGSKTQAMQQAKAAMFEAGRELSKSLLETHKREADDQQKKVHGQFEATSRALHEQLKDVVSSVTVLKDQVGQSKETLEIVQRGLLSPSGAGTLAEISLENLLKNMGLQHGQDFMMQFTVAGDGGSQLRPDAVVFLPGNHVLIIDSKASKCFLEMEKGERDSQEVAATLKKTMASHLKGLYSKAYHDAVKKAVELDRKERITQVTTVMYIPTDAALQTLQQVDPHFMKEAWDHHIYPAGPSTLAAILSHASHVIAEKKRTANMEQIMEEVHKLVSTIHTLHGHAYKLGQGLRSSLMHFDKFSGSFNKSLGVRLKKLQEYGIETGKKNQSDPKLQRYQLTSLEYEEAESTEDVS